ncbi:coenzyme F390 synthetase [Streptomyces viridosporus ATCC 14672]|uniref:Coenzyme F390 synthetase n=1 Tax=Streptomyces viridosporus (strain ATCC 14672 / DSM 40746 / JCM 4963 / KCTC 9882 / NRRL B-12104 / FH 1290) TaxID=566461 RepID=D6AA82_STRV1|nr:AMP-binding protein [Streptomyces viridosporus]EFE72417.1 coenzyme F390 synthetase [Streptomyces viridosporus ATCC 14672]
MTAVLQAASVRGDRPLEDFLSEYRKVSRAFYDSSLTDAELARWRARQLTTVLHHVTDRSPFYRCHLAGVDIDRVTPEDLTALPFTTKEDLRREMYDVLSGPVGEASIYYETNGTTGTATPCPRGPKDIATSNAAVEESWRRLFRTHFGDRMPVVGLMGPSELYAFGDVFTAVTASLGACHVKIWPESPRVGFQKALRLIEELGVEVVVCAPALCLSLAKAALHHGYDLARLPVKLFLVLGEICTSQFAANVSTVWPQAVVRPALYGSQEALCIATGADTGRLHLSAPNYLPEVIDPDTGRVLGDTGEGELVLTMLVDGIKPLIRYRTGDLVRITPAPRDAPLPGPVVEVVGRVADRIALGHARLYPAQLESAVLEGVRGCLGYQVVVDHAPGGGDEITVRMDLLSRVADPDATAGAVAGRLRALTGARVRVAVDTDLDPVTHTGSFVSWKAARVRDLRSAPDRAVEAARQVAHRYAITT